MKQTAPCTDRPQRRTCLSTVVATAGLCAALIVGGCGGGGASSQYLGRSYYFSNGSRMLSLTTDTTGRFTVVARDSSVLPTAASGQGIVGSDGVFSTQSSDGAVSFYGVFQTDGGNLSCDVRQSSSTLFHVEAARVPEGSSAASALAGTYRATGTTQTANLSVDSSGHGTLFVSCAAGTGGGLLSFAADGSFTSYDDALAGTLNAGRTNPELLLTRLNGSSVNVLIPLDTSKRAKWTFMVYLNAANDLQTFGPLNVNQMEKVGSSADVNIVVQWKQASCSTCGSPAWVSTRRYFITRDSDTGRVTSPLLEDLGPNVDMGDWRTLYAFIAWVQRNYPADRYALVIWNHGAGWRSTRAGQAPVLRSVSIDDSTGSEIATWQLPQALNVSPKVDLLIFDASLMQMMEVAYEVRDSASIMVGSEESPPGEGYVYDRFLQDLAANPSMTPVALATSIVNRTLESYGSSSNITQSAVDLSKLTNLASRLDAFARLLLFYGPSYGADLAAARKNAESYLYRDNKDLWHYAELVRTRPVPADLQVAASDVKDAVSAAVIAEAHGSLHPNSHGLAIYVPEPASYLLSYANLALSRVTQWDEWLRAQPAN